MRLIETPTDFRRTIGTDLYSIENMVSAPPEVEPEIRHALDSIFEDLVAIRRSRRARHGEI